jgi:hypothetical protein
MFDTPQSQSFRDWALTAAVVIAVHALAIVFLLRAHEQAHTNFDNQGDGAGLAGVVSGAAPARSLLPIRCSYQIMDGRLSLTAIDRGTFGKWATCIETIDTAGLNTAKRNADRTPPLGPRFIPYPASRQIARYFSAGFTAV